MGLYKRGRVWWMSFTHEGRQVRKSTRVTDKRLAEKIYYKAMTDVAERKWFERLPGEDRTLRDMLERYINEYAASNKSSKTVKLDRTIVKEMLEFFGDVMLINFSPAQIVSYIVSCRRRGLAHATIRYRLCLLRHAFDLAMREWEWIKDNPVTRIKGIKVNNTRDRWLTVEEEKRLLDCLCYICCSQG